MRGASVLLPLAIPLVVSLASCAGTTGEREPPSAVAEEPNPAPSAGTPPPKPAPPPVSESPPTPPAQAGAETGPEAGAPSPGPATPGAAAAKAPAVPKTPAEQKIEASMTLRKERRYDEAVALLREALTLSPPPDTALDIYMKMGEARFRKAQDAQYGRIQNVAIEEELKEATRILDEGLAKYPDLAKSGDVAFLRGSSFLMAGRLDEAKAAYLGLMRRYPTYPYNHQALLRVGICEASLGDAPAARTTLEQLVAAYPDKEVEVKKARRYIDELRVFGQRAKPITADKWIREIAKDGLATFDGEVRVLIFFATWCDNCAHEIPHLRSLIQELGAKGVVFLGIANPDDPKNTVAVDVYLEREKIPFLDVALDRTFASWNAYRVVSLPAGVVIDRKGVVRWRGHPAFFPKGLVEGLLAEEAKPSS